MKPASVLMVQYNAVWLLFTVLGSAIGVVVVAAAARLILKAKRRRSSNGERSALRHTLGKTALDKVKKKLYNTIQCSFIQA